jgi:O-antigen/teichoic acid export membrane protein
VLSPWFAWIVFKDVQQSRLVQMLAFALAAVIVSNFLGELFTSLRQVRVVSWMQLANSLVFALVGVCLLCFTPLREEAVMVAFIAGCVTASLVAACVMHSTWRLLPATSQPLRNGDLWFKLLPLAGWLWTTNLLTNLFDAADRFMIVHFAGVGTEAAEALVGQYHCSRVVPLLLVGFASMLGGVVMPHLSHDWEASRRQDVSRRLNVLLKLMALAFTAGGVVILLASPMLFGWVLRGKYNDGLSVMPWTLIYCIWFSMAMVGQMYMWCAEKAKLGSFALLIGLLTNIVLNLLLLPRLGLLGAILSTAVGNAIALLLILLLNRRLGMRVDRGTWLATGLPLLLALNGNVAAVAMLVIGWAAWQGGWLFSDQEKSQFADHLGSYMERARQWFRHREPVST